jgi:hypothetical protein
VCSQAEQTLGRDLTTFASSCEAKGLVVAIPASPPFAQIWFAARQERHRSADARAVQRVDAPKAEAMPHPMANADDPAVAAPLEEEAVPLDIVQQPEVAPPQEEAVHLPQDESAESVPRSAASLRGAHADRTTPIDPSRSSRRLPIRAAEAVGWEA